MPVPDEVFLSHSSADRAFTARLADVLRDHGVRVWYSDTNILGAQQWHDEIGAALRRCDWLVVVLTPDAVESKWFPHPVLSLGDPLRGRSQRLNADEDVRVPPIGVDPTGARR